VHGFINSEKASDSEKGGKHTAQGALVGEGTLGCYDLKRWPLLSSRAEVTTRLRGQSRVCWAVAAQNLCWVEGNFTPYMTAPWYLILTPWCVQIDQISQDRVVPEQA